MPGDTTLRERVTTTTVRYGWVPLLALAATQALESGERQSLAQAADGIQRAFHISNTAVSFLPTAMGLVVVIGAPVFGILADRTRRVWLLAGGIAVWTLCMGLNGLAPSFALLFLFRMGVGSVETNGPAAFSLLADYYPVQDRARMFGFYQGGALAGAVVGLIGGGVAVQLGGFRWAFFMWIPFGIAVTLFLLRQPEPARGLQDAAFRDACDGVESFDPGGDSDAAAGAEVAARLPPPRRVGTLDYERATPREVFRELRRIPSMWYGVTAIAVSQLLLNALTFWGVKYFKEVHHLKPAAAGGIMGLLAMGTVVGILGGGVVSDRLLRRGVVCARVYVVAFGSIAATAVLMPAFAVRSLLITSPLLLVGGILLTVAVAPAEAMMSDVVVAELRGRAATVRSIVRVLSTAGYVIVGVLADRIGLRWALVWTCPLYAAGGVIALFAVRHYPADLAFVLAESRRRAPGEQVLAPAPA